MKFDGRPRGDSNRSPGRSTQRGTAFPPFNLFLLKSGDGDVVTGSLKPVIAYIVIWRPKVHLIREVRSQRWLIIEQNP